MKTVIITDNKPVSCENCMYYTEIFVDCSDNVKNYVSLENGCLLTNTVGGKCPLLEDKNYIDNLNIEKDFILFTNELED